jgi:hypothetical protein
MSNTLGYLNTKYYRKFLAPYRIGMNPGESEGTIN